MRSALTILAQLCDSTIETFAWHKLNYEQVQALRAKLLAKYKSRTTNRLLAALRGVLKACWRGGLMTTEEYQHATDVKVTKISEEPAGRMLSLDELRRLITHDGSKTSRRDSAIVTVMYAGGLRRFEAAKLRREDYDRKTGHLSVRGKGNRIRRVKIQVSWRKPLEEWLDLIEHDFMFVDKADETKHISERELTSILERRRISAKVERFTSHDLRRTLLSNLIDSGVDLVVIKKIAGHSDINTTAGYDRRGQDAEDAAIDELEDL